ncbi:MAG: hypothetical protein AB1765_10610 [Candidatus Hydrogenedentota bacterium]
MGYWVIGLLGYCVIALSCFLPLASFVIFLFCYLASCFLLLLDIIIVTAFFRGGT